MRQFVRLTAIVLLCLCCYNGAAPPKNKTTRRKPSSSKRTSSSRGGKREAEDASPAQKTQETVGQSGQLTVEQRIIVDEYLINDLLLKENPLKMDDRSLAKNLQNKIKHKLHEKVDRDLLMEYVNSKFKQLNSKIEENDLHSTTTKEPINWDKYHDLLAKRANLGVPEKELSVIVKLIKAMYGDDITTTDLGMHFATNSLNYKMRGRRALPEDEAWDEAFTRLIAKITKGSQVQYLISNDRYPHDAICNNPKAKAEFFRGATKNKALIEELCEWMSSIHMEMMDDVDKDAFPTYNLIKPNGVMARGVRRVQQILNAETVAGYQSIALSRTRELIHRRIYRGDSVAQFEELGHKIASNLYIFDDYLRHYLQILRYAYQTTITDANPEAANHFYAKFASSGKVIKPTVEDALFYSTVHCPGTSARKAANFLHYMCNVARSLHQGCVPYSFDCAAAAAVNSLRTLKEMLAHLVSDENTPIFTLLDQLIIDFTAGSIDIRHRTIVAKFNELNAKEKLATTPPAASALAAEAPEQASLLYSIAKDLINDAVSSADCLTGQCTGHKDAMTIDDLREGIKYSEDLRNNYKYKNQST